ncbi:MAG TPA: hypothetical protein VNP36_17055 [Burkholderiales bacterium]|nr:hypothetical protein [Burkholderiales bacterium]
MKRLAVMLLAGMTSSAVPAGPPRTEPTTILFVGNSFTFGRLDPVMSHNAGEVDDLTRPRPNLPGAPFTDTTGTRAWEPHPWGGVPGIFKQLADQAGRSYVVSMSARNAASLRGHFLNTANPENWDLRANIASKKWDVVVLQEQSDAALPAGRGANANLPQFSAYVDKIERFIHVGTPESYRERALFTALYGSTAACVAAGGTEPSCSNNALRTIPANPNASPHTKVYLTQTWARPDMVFPHLATLPNADYPAVPDGRPIVDTSNPDFPHGFPDPLYYSSLAAMTMDLHRAFYDKARTNPGFADVIPVGDAFQRALDERVAKDDDFYDASGVHTTPRRRDRMNLWWDDYLHASRYGSYLSALVIFGALTHLDPRSFGAREQAASDLRIAPSDAERLQRVASDQLRHAGIALERIRCLHSRKKHECRDRHGRDRDDDDDDDDD